MQEKSITYLQEMNINYDMEIIEFINKNVIKMKQLNL